MASVRAIQINQLRLVTRNLINRNGLHHKKIPQIDIQTINRLIKMVMTNTVQRMTHIQTHEMIEINKATDSMEIQRHRQQCTMTHIKCNENKSHQRW